MPSGVDTTIFALDPIWVIWSISEDQTTQCGNAKKAYEEGLWGEISC